MKTRCTICKKNWITSVLKQNHNTGDYICPVCAADGRSKNNAKKN